MAYISFKPKDFFNTLLYTGDGSASQAQTGLGFQPDFNWTKARGLSESNTLTDSVRGATQTIYSNLNSTQSAIPSNLKSFDADGFTMGSNGEVGQNSENYASWNWRMGTTTGIAGSADITPSAYSFNQTTGMSIVKYTGNAGAIRTVLHGLGSAPDMIMIKQLTTGTNAWVVGGNNIVSDWGGVLTLNTTAAIFTNAFFGGAVPNATTFSISNTSEVNSSGTYVAYCMRSIKGFSKFGSYTGNGNASGTFINTGFRPQFFIAKESNAVDPWHMWTGNVSTSGANNINKSIQPNDVSAEATDNNKDVDFLASGVKLRTSNSEINGSGSPYIYMAWAAEPIVGSGGTPGVAR